MQAATATNYEKLNTLIASLTEKELSTPFDFSKEEQKKEAHWNRDKDIMKILEDTAGKLIVIDKAG